MRIVALWARGGFYILWSGRNAHPVLDEPHIRARRSFYLSMGLVLRVVWLFGLAIYGLTTYKIVPAAF